MIAYRKWTREAVVANIKDIHAAGVALNCSSIRRTHPALSGAARKHHGSWRNAVRAAGLEYLLPKRRTWSHEKIVKRIAKRGARGKALHQKAALAWDARFVSAAQRYFGNWSKAVRAAGLRPERFTKPDPLTTEEAIQVVQDRVACALPVSAHRMRLEVKDVYLFVCRRFRSWDAFLQTAGLDPDKHRGRRPNGMAHPKAHPTRRLRRWSPKIVLRRILERECRALPLNAKAICTDDMSLYLMGRKYFGSWRDALLAAGISDPDKVSLRRRWSRELLLRQIRKRALEGKPMNYEAVHRETGLAEMGKRRFGSWDRTLLIAGVDPAKARKMRPPWTKEEIVGTLRERVRNRLPVNMTAIPVSSLRQSAQRLFGSWDNTLRATGLDPDKVRSHRRPWTRSAIILTLKARARNGQSLAVSTIKPNSFRVAAQELFGSWNAALKAAGIKKVRKKS